jgi:SPP1 family predicted phage head-tail adaptor
MEWASQLNQRVTLMDGVRTSDELGGETLSWQPLATLWAQVEPVGTGSRERARAGQLEGLAGYRVRLRLRQDIRATQRLQWRERLLVIHSLHERGEILEILAYEEGV